MSSFEMSPGSACCILIAIYVSGDSEEKVRHLLPFKIRTGTTCICVMLWAAIRYKTCTTLVRIDYNVDKDQYVSDILGPKVKSCLRGKLNAIFQQDNAKPYVACRILTILDTQGIRLLPWLERSPDL